jgi:hypothetical protein
MSMAESFRAACKSAWAYTANGRHERALVCMIITREGECRMFAAFPDKESTRTWREHQRPRGEHLVAVRMYEGGRQIPVPADLAFGF